MDRERTFFLGDGNFCNHIFAFFRVCEATAHGAEAIARLHPEAALFAKLHEIGKLIPAIRAKKSIVKTTYDVLLGEAEPNECIIATEFKNLSIVPSNINLAGAEFDLFDVDHRERRLKQFIEKCGDAYDLVVIDCPPSLSMLTVNALTASDGVIIPMQCEFYALEGLTQLMMTISKVKKLYNPSLCVLGILVTMFNGRLNLSTAVLAEIKKYYGDKLFSTMIPRSVKLSEAPGFGQPIMYFDKNSKGSIAYSALCDEFLSQQK